MSMMIYGKKLKEVPKCMGIAIKWNSLLVMSKDGPLALGMHKKNTFHDIVNITDCQIVDNDYNLIVKCALNIAQQMELPFYHKMRHEGYFRTFSCKKSRKFVEIFW